MLQKSNKPKPNQTFHYSNRITPKSVTG